MTSPETFARRTLWEVWWPSVTVYSRSYSGKEASPSKANVAQIVDLTPPSSKSPGEPY